MTVLSSALATAAGSNISLGKYVHDVVAGRVECRLCGGRAFSRNANAISRWQMAHDKCCRGYKEGLLARIYPDR